MRVRLGREPRLSRSLLVLIAVMTLGAPGMGILTAAPRIARAAESGDIDQCANGGVGKTDLQCTGSNWQNGNLNGNQAHYNEGDSVPYRMRFGGLTPLSTNTVTIGWDILQGDKHALDYLTSYFRTETDAVPCSDVPLCGATSTTLQIPPDPNAPPGNQIGGVFTLYDGELKSASAYTRDDNKALISLTFVATTATPVLAWGGHIATRADWGAGNSAVAISGSPYHMRLIALNGKGGNQDRSLSSEAVIFPASITIVKDASPNASQAFGFTGVGVSPSPFSLVDDGNPADPPDRKVFGSITDFGATRTVTEDVVAGWTLTNLACTHSNPDTSPTITTNLDSRTVSIKPAEGDDVTCTYTNVKSPAINLLKTADPTSIDEPGGPVLFTIAVHNESVVEKVALQSLIDNVYGDITAVSSKIVDTTCSVPHDIAPNGTYSCSFHANVAGDAKTGPVTDVVTGSAKDIRGNTLTASDDETVNILDVKPSLVVDKSVAPSELAESGGLVTFTVDVTNPTNETLTLNTLTDDKFGPLAGQGTCGTLPLTIAPKDKYSCHFDQTLPPTNAGGTHIDIVTGEATDNEGNKASDTGTATVTFLDVPPKLVIDKSVSPTELPEPGGHVSYTIVVTNPANAIEPITLNKLEDKELTDTTCDVSAGVLLKPGEHYTCTFEKDLTGNAKDVHVNTATATAVDDDGTPVTDSDDATVTFIDVKPLLEVEKIATQVSVPEPGADVSFQIKVTNPKGAAEPITLLSLKDSVYGDLTNKGSCLLPGVLILIAPGDTYTCSFTGPVTGKTGDRHKNTVTGTAEDDEHNPVSDTSDALVTIRDVLPTLSVVKDADPPTVAEPGGNVVFTVTVRNTSPSGADPIVLTKLEDSVYGNLDNLGTCTLTPTITLAVGAEYSCWFMEEVKGDANSEANSKHTDVVSVTGHDDENNPATASDDATVTVTDVKPSITVEKAAAPTEMPEPGGDVTYTVTVTNTSVEDVTIQSLSDAPAGGQVIDLIGKDTCMADKKPVTIIPKGTYSCTFTLPVNGEPGSYDDTVTAVATDNEGNPASDSAKETVKITDVTPEILVSKAAAPDEVKEPGGDVTFTVVVTNPPSAVEAVDVTKLTDSAYGNLGDLCDLSKATNIAPAGSYTCTFAKRVEGNANSEHTNVVTAQAKDNEDNPSPEVTDNAVVKVVDVLPKIGVTKSPSVNSLPEPGGKVDFTVTVKNNDPAESLTLTKLNDNPYGDLNGQGDCKVPQTIESGKTYTCTFPIELNGLNAGTEHSDTVTAEATDDDKNTVTDTATAVVKITDVKPNISVTKAALETELPEPGGTVDFKVTVTNPDNAVEPVTITSLVDSVFKDLDGKGTCDLDPPVKLEPGGQYSCTFPGVVKDRNAGFVHTNEVTGTAVDDEENEATDKDDAKVTITDVLPKIDLIKTAGVSTVHAGDEVTYTYTVTNPQIEPLSDVTVTDDRCSPVEYASGDVNKDKLLTLGEVWTFTCTAKLTGTTTNTGTGTGKDDEGNTATDTDKATVTVLDPRIAIDKVANLKKVGVGDSVQFTYTVKNPGDAPLSNVVVTDDKCGPVTFTSGDTNGDGLLDPSETWRFDCTATMSTVGDITNTGTVKGKDPIGLEVTATDTAVVSVLEVEVLPAVERPSPPLLPAPGPLQQTLPVTGADLMRWALSGLGLIAGGSLLRRRREPRPVALRFPTRAAGLALIAVAGVIALFGGRSGGGPKLSDDARRYPPDARKVFVTQVRTADGQQELADAKDVELVNRGAAFCVQLAKTGSGLKAVFALQLAGETHPGDVYVTAAARRVLCPGLPDSDPRPSPG